MRITAKADYAVRAAAVLAAAPPGERVTAEQIAQAQAIPRTFLHNILGELRRAGIVAAVRGPDGGFSLARPPHTITLAEVIRTVEGPLASVQEQRPEDVTYPGAAAALRDVWVALRASMRSVLEAVSLADLVRGDLPASVRELANEPGAWVARW